MQSEPPQITFMLRALKRLAFWGGVTIVCGAAMVLVALYVPETYLLNEEKDSGLASWLPGGESLSAEMLWVAASKSSNDEIARQYSDAESFEQQLDAWGRELGYTQIYVNRDRCSTVGPRQITFNLVWHTNPAGAEQYFAWLRQNDLKAHGEVTEIAAGDEAYAYWLAGDGMCSPNQSEQLLELSFRRSSVIGTVKVISSSVLSQDALLTMATRWLQVMDELVQVKLAEP